MLLKVTMTNDEAPAIWDGTRPQGDPTGHAFANAFAQRVIDAHEGMGNQWKEAILEQLVVACMDAPLDEPPASILRRIIDFHVMLDRGPVMQQAKDPLSEAQVWGIIHAKHFNEGYPLEASDSNLLRWYVMGLRNGEEAHGIKKMEYLHDWH